MQAIIYLIIGLVAGYFWGKKAAENTTKVINAGQLENKQQNLAAVLRLAESKPEISNDDVEAALGVSNATAERYLNELEQQGKLIQVGRTGRNVVYKKS